MTLVVGLVHKGCVYMGTDSAEVRGPLTVRREQQIFCRNSFLMGFPRSFRDGNLLGYDLGLQGLESQLQSVGDDGLHEFMVLKVVGTILDYFKNSTTRLVDELRIYLKKTPIIVVRNEPEGGETEQADQEEKKQEPGPWFLVGCRGRLFTIWSDLRVVEAYDGYDAIGAGAHAALGALYATRHECPQQRVCRALHAAERLTGAVRPPFRVWCLKSDVECEECQGTRPHLRAV